MRSYHRQINVPAAPGNGTPLYYVGSLVDKVLEFISVTAGSFTVQGNNGNVDTPGDWHTIPTTPAALIAAGSYTIPGQWKYIRIVTGVGGTVVAFLSGHEPSNEQ
jgi:hypothetical protein